MTTINRLRNIAKETGGHLATLASIVAAGKAAVTETSAAAILAKLSADPATQTTLAAVLAKIIAAPATEAKQDTLNTNITNLRGQITAALGQAARAASLGVTLSTEDAAKVPSLGQALAASSVPVVLTAIQIAQLAQTGQLPAALGIAAQSAALVNVPAAMTVLEFAAVPIVGVQLKSGPGIVGYSTVNNTTGAVAYWQIHSSAATPAAGARPLEASAATVANNSNTKIYPGNGVPGLPSHVGLWFVLSTTQWTYTPVLAASGVAHFTVY